jgi:hypothetical protein
MDALSATQIKQTNPSDSSPKDPKAQLLEVAMAALKTAVVRAAAPVRIKLATASTKTPTVSAKTSAPPSVRLATQVVNFLKDAKGNPPAGITDSRIPSGAEVVKVSSNEYTPTEWKNGPNGVIFSYQKVKNNNHPSVGGDKAIRLPQTLTPPNGANYVLMSISSGSVHRPIANENWYEVSAPSKVVGYAGDKDKSVALIKLEPGETFKFASHDEIQLSWIDSPRDLKVLNDKAPALDDELIAGDDNEDRVDTSLRGAITHRRVEAWSNSASAFAYYSDDESNPGEHPERVEKFIDYSYLTFQSGDDSPYILAPGQSLESNPNKKGIGNGNGAIIQIGFT